jgi:mono/diheme cytochrome c family protein
MQSLARLRAAAVRYGLARFASLGCAAILGAAIASACGKPRQLSAVARGEVIYRTNCASCHNPHNPNLPGSIGPAIAGASRALLVARVLHAAYPPGYTPQRKTHTMRPLPWLNGHVDDLAAYLAFVKAHHPGT